MDLVLKTDSSLSVQLSHLPVGYPWPGYSVLQCPLQRGLSRMLGGKCLPEGLAWGWGIAWSPSSAARPQKEALAGLRGSYTVKKLSYGWGWGGTGGGGLDSHLPSPPSIHASLR